MKGLALYVAAAMTSVIALAPLSAQARQYRSADVQPADYPTVKAVQSMSDELNKETNGKISVKVFPNSQLGSEKDTIEQVKLGALDFIRINSGTLNTVCPAMTVPVLPFLFRDKAHMRAVLDGPIGDEILADCASHGLVGLAFYDSGARSFYATTPIRKLEDLKGKKIRVQQSDIWVSMMKLLGANATPMPAGEVFTGLKSGLIDGAENNWPSYDNFHHYEAAKNYSLSEHSMAPEVLLISKRVFDSFTPEEQAQVRKAAKNSVGYMRQLWDAMEISSREKVEKAGVEVITIDKAPFQAAVQPLYDQFVTDPKLKDMITRIKAAQ
ncbi:TRAP transporter substrate-binding protein [Xanthobacter oligotrophicus]|uniref:TRAP transporter substrate-binding protein n=1 Tax=Xanthobacter oligotrophicus TaxID=2607286 RepID=UPI0011F1D0FA|nr:TRAP transporter substrate-binding protein [Xanthobacter oligotrophicus]MCG5237987.1 TRAP transporter substrate-binding protein [Xanthobacter oligotrophicus]